MSVDWGDGHRDGPFDQPGARWPNGSVTHVWTDADLHDVVVTVRWRATWRLGEEGGVLTDLFTEGVIKWLEAVNR